MKRAFAILILLAACKHDGGGTTTPPGGGGGSGSGSAVVEPAKPKTPFEQRRGEVCPKLAKKITQCAVEDLKKEVAAGRMKQAEYDATVKPEILNENTKEAMDSCLKVVTTHQLRVMEVCNNEAPCDGLSECLQHANDAEPATK